MTFTLVHSFTCMLPIPFFLAFTLNVSNFLDTSAHKLCNTTTCFYYELSLRPSFLTRHATSSGACALQPQQGSRTWHEAYLRRLLSLPRGTVFYIYICIYQFSLVSCPENSTLLLYFCTLSTSRRIPSLYFAHRPSDIYILAFAEPLCHARNGYQRIVSDVDRQSDD